jgi:hypothetical protein
VAGYDRHARLAVIAAERENPVIIAQKPGMVPPNLSVACRTKEFARFGDGK